MLTLPLPTLGQELSKLNCQIREQMDEPKETLNEPSDHLSYLVERLTEILPNV
jgi:TorA maturation chaperone TorD